MPSVSIAPIMTNVTDVSAQEDMAVFAWEWQRLLRTVISIGIRLSDRMSALAHTRVTYVAEQMV